MSHHQSGLLDEAREAYLELLRRSPNNPRIEYNLAHCLLQLQRADEALEHFRRAAELSPIDAEFHAAYANALTGVAQFDRSLEAARRAAAIKPDHGPARYLVCYSLERLNRNDEALREVDASIAAVPTHAPLRILRARLVARQPEGRDAAIAELQAVIDHPAVGRAARRQAWHEMGMLLDREQRFDEAYRAFRESGTLAASSPEAARFSRDDRMRQIRSYRAGIKPAMLRRIPLEQVDRLKRIRHAFLVGFPRSGTTMTEQILAAHPRITTGDEWPLMTGVARRAQQLAGSQASPAAILSRLTAEQINSLRAAYWNEVESRAGWLDDGDVFVDKLPLNLISLGLINVVFPDARVMVALRDPRDVCLSCFMQDFRLNHSMIHFLTLENTAAFYESVMDLYLHLREMVTLPLMEIRYEDTVTDLETQARRILDHLGVDWDASVLQFHEEAQSRMISTPSAAAVREPVHQRAVARWKNYEQPMAGIMPRLDRFVQAFGYDRR